MIIRQLLAKLWFPLLLLALTITLYWQTSTFLFVWDDAPHFLQYIRPTLWDIWSNRTGYGYYRPLTFTFLKITYQVWEWPAYYYFDVMLGIHWACALLVGQIAGRLTRGMKREVRKGTAVNALIDHGDSPWYAAAAALLFVTYPFAALVLTSVPAINHSFVLLLTLVAICAMLRYFDRAANQNLVQARLWLLLAVTCTFLSPFAHENGITTGLLVILLVAVDQGWKAWKVWKDRWLLFTLPLLNLIFVAIWMSVPKTGPGMQWVGWKSIGSSFTFYVQGLTYVIQPMAQRLILRGWPELTTVWTAALLCLFFVLLVLGYQRHWRLLLAGFGWFLISILPSVLALPYAYIFPAMRLHYFPGVAAVLLLSGSAITLSQWLRPQQARQMAAAMIFFGVLIPVIFIYRIVQLHQYAMQPIRQMTAIVSEHPNDSYLLINALDWISYRSTWYPLGHEGAELMPSYVLPSQIVTINERQPVNMQEVVFPPLQDRLDHYFYGLNHEEYMTRDVQDLAQFILQADRVLVTSFQPEQITVQDVGSVHQVDAVKPSIYLANFEEKVFLLSASAKVNAHNLVLSLNWKYLGPDPNATVFRHVLDCNGNLLGQGDGHVLGRAIPFLLIPVGAEIRDVREISIGDSNDASCYRVEVGLFHPDGARLAITDENNQRSKDSFVAIEVAK